jgi:5-methyltetrahydropteroyltriglutamate--homocysteine methyltransferase
MLTTHIGSMARPPELLELLTDRSGGKPVDKGRFEALVAVAVRDVVRRQVDVGLAVVNDGEQSKVSFASYLKDRLSGFDIIADRTSPPSFRAEAEDFPEYYARPSTLANDKYRKLARQAACVGPIGWQDFSEVERDVGNLKQAASGLECEDIFVSAMSPSVAAGSQPNRHYPTQEAYLYALADVLQREYRAIVQAGFVLQVDLPLAGVRSRPAEGGSRADVIQAFRKDLQLNVEALNHALTDIPAESTRMHVCFGSDAGPHHLDPELIDLIDILLQAKPAGITLVGASPRHAYEWRIWEQVQLPEDKVIIPGVVDHTTNIIEHPATVAERIIRYASVVGKDRVIAGVDCGFDPSAGIEELRVDNRIMWAKLRSLADGAALASQELWR